MWLVCSALEVDPSLFNVWFNLANAQLKANKVGWHSMNWQAWRQNQASKRSYNLLRGSCLVCLTPERLCADR